MPRQSEFTSNKVRHRFLAAFDCALPVLTALAMLAATLAQAQTKNQNPSAGENPASKIPVPQKRPQQEMPAATTQGQPASNAETSAPTGTTLVAIDEAAQLACERQLNAMGVTFEKLPPVSDGNGCLVPAPLEVSSLGVSVSLKPPAILNCSVTLAAANWVKNVVQPFADKSFPGKKLSAIRQASGYVCRPRNNAEGARLSEHATANAIDIAGFEFDDKSFHEVKIRQRTGSLEEAFQKAVRFSACLDFTTVLGPLSDANHSDHLHFDLAQRRGGYRLCQFPELTGESQAKPAE